MRQLCCCPVMLRDHNDKTENKKLVPEPPELLKKRVDLTHCMKPPISVGLSVDNIYLTTDKRYPLRLETMPDP